MLLLFLILNFLVHSQQEPLPSFKEQTIDSAISIGYGLALGDVDGDKKPDILLADKKQIVWYRNGDWKKFIMAENLTEFDNVCIAARDIDGDGKVEVAVGAQWNPSETTDDALSGSVHYLVRPSDPHQQWKSVRLHHEPTIHRMRWVKSSDGKYYLVVLPLHGRGNKNGEGTGVKIFAYGVPKDVNSEWPIYELSGDMHMTHNMDIDEKPGATTKVLVAGKEGIRMINEPFNLKQKGSSKPIPGRVHGSGEVRIGKDFVAAIQPMHGNEVVVYRNASQQKIVLDSSLKEGHALGIADFSGVGHDQVVAGWRNPDANQMVGIKLYTRKSKQSDEWQSSWLDKNGMACEDLQVMDLNGDGKQDIIASGRSTRNVKIYWNQ